MHSESPVSLTKLMKAVKDRALLRAVLSHFNYYFKTIKTLIIFSAFLDSEMYKIGILMNNDLSSRKKNSFRVQNY